MNKQKATAIAKKFFKTYPSVNAFHITSDEQAFEEKQNADAHGRSLGKEKDAVVTVTRDEAEAAKDEDAEAVAAEKKAAAEAAAAEKKAAAEAAAAEKKAAAEAAAAEKKAAAEKAAAEKAAAKAGK